MAPDTDSNPYSAPTSASANIAGVDFAPIIRRWERLRIYYNAILISLVLLVTIVRFPGHVSDPAYWAKIAFFGLIANLCFLTGPAIEGYGTRLRIWNGAMTMVLFLAGLGLTAYLAIACIAALTGTF